MKILVHIGFLYLLKQNVRQSRVLWNVPFCFDSFGGEHIPKEVNKSINNDTTKLSAIAHIKSSISRIQAYSSIICGYFCIEFINYMLKGKALLDYTNLFSPNDFKKNDQVIKRIFKNE